jgi:hypothetical protein
VHPQRIAGERLCIPFARRGPFQDFCYWTHHCVLTFGGFDRILVQILVEAGNNGFDLRPDAIQIEPPSTNRNHFSHRNASFSVSSNWILKSLLRRERLFTFSLTFYLLLLNAPDDVTCCRAA